MGTGWKMPVFIRESRRGNTQKTICHIWYNLEVRGTINQEIPGTDLYSVICNCFLERTAVKALTKLKSGFVPGAWPNPVSHTYKYSFNNFSPYHTTCMWSPTLARLVNSQCTNRNTIPISRPTDATCDRFLFSIHMYITLHVSRVKRSSSGVPHCTYSLQILELKLCFKWVLNIKILKLLKLLNIW
jgi:hypothetical protein